MQKENNDQFSLKSMLNDKGLRHVIVFSSIVLLTVFDIQAKELAHTHSKELSGIWKTLSGDVYIKINDSQLSYFEVTKGNKTVASKGTCLSIKSSDINGDVELSIPSDISEFKSVSQDEISYDAPGDLFPNSLFRANKLPEVCNKPVKLSNTYMHRPSIDFDIFWNNINENYAFLSHRGFSQKDWENVYLQNRSLALKTTKKKELFELFAKIMDQTFTDRNVNGEILKGDGHVVLSEEADDLKWRYKSPSSKGYSRGRILLTNPLDSYLNLRIDQDTFEPLVNKGAIWGVYSFFGKLKEESTGYLLLNSMVDYHQDKSIEVSIDDFELQKTAVKKWMDKVVTTAKAHGLDKIIIDVRNNMGGYDKTTMQIASYFMQKSKLVFIKQSRIGGNIDTPLWSTEEHVRLSPNINNYEGKVVVLTSRHTVSAGESFALIMSRLPQVRLIGEATTGALSDILQKHSSNGWLLSLSHQRYHYPDAELLSYATTPEGKGILPDIAITYDALSLYKPKDANAIKPDYILEKAIELQW